MPITWTYNSRDNALRSKGAGVIAPNDLYCYVREVVGSPDVHAGFFEIVDFAQVTDIAGNFSSFNALHDYWHKYIQKGCRGTVVYATSLHIYGMLRVVKVAVEEEDTGGVKFRVVKSKNEFESVCSSWGVALPQ